jgi:hypothetical protein
VYDNVGTVLQGVDQVRRWQGVVDNERDAGLVGHRRSPLDIQGVERGVPYGLGINGLRLVRDRRAYGVKIRRVGELHVYTDLGQRVVELGVGAAVFGEREQVRRVVGIVEDI